MTKSHNFVAALALALTACSPASELYANEPLHMVTINPSVPKTMTFAGEKMDLEDVDLYERLDRELTSMVYTHGNTLLTIKRANRYFPVLSKMLKDKGLSEDFLYLACIESYLNPIAKSPAGAAGIWQFMPSTAKQYGLEVSDEVDERYDVEKSTAAACRYLQSGLQRFGNWESVAASYNGGMARITKELEAQNVDSALDLWLADETRRYPLRMMAMKLIMQNPRKYGFILTDDQLYQPYSYTTVTVDGPVEDWPTWAQAYGIDYATLREYNPWIRAKKLTNKTGKSYTVRIPESGSLRRSTRNLQTFNHNWTH